MQYELLFFILLPASLLDIANYKIPNSLIVAGGLMGLIVQIGENGLKGILMWLCGVVIPFILFFLLYMLHFFGAADGKLFAVTGGFTGIEPVFWIIIFSLVFGGFFAVVKLLVSGTFSERMKRGVGYFVRSVQNKRIVPYEPGVQSDSSMPFSVAITLGYLFCAGI